MDVHIYLKNQPDFRATKAPFDPSLFTHAGTIHSDRAGDDALEAAYCAAQNVNSAWNPRQPCRSVSVGDVLKLAEQHYVVAPVGFVALPAVTDAPSRRGFVIVHRDDGIYLGNALGLGFFSKLDPVGQNQAVAFDSIQAATEHLSSWAIAEASDMQAYQFVEVLLNSNGCATIEACVKAGLESWGPAP